jgi:hypothetical protein
MAKLLIGKPSAQRPFVALALCLCALVAALLLLQTRHMFLDDTFIHLRIARNLATRGIYSFNGDARAYSTSSPLYTALLAALWRAWPSIWLPKWVNILAYAGLLALLSRQAWQARTSRQAGLYLMWIIAITSPLAIRWLADGMETVLVALASAAFGSCIATLRSKSSDATYHFLLLLGLLAAAATVLRVEAAFVVALAVAAFAGEALWRRQWPSGPTRWALFSLVGGSLLSLLAIRGYFGYLLPDTAIAKAGYSSSADAIVHTISSHIGASLFGCGMAATWLASLWFAWRSVSQRVFIAVLNSGLPVLVALIALRHQAVQGYRYFVFIEFFLVACNAQLIAPSEHRAPLRGTLTLRRVTLLSLAVAAMLVWEAYDWRHLEVISAGRSVTFERFLNGNLSQLRGKRGLAWDVGMIGYFSEATILDADGLVNGREMAKLSSTERLRRLSAIPVDFVFANGIQRAQIPGMMQDKTWRLAGEYTFPNFSGDPDTHYLLVRD